MQEIHEKRFAASHELWQAKAASRLESLGRIHQELGRLAHEGKIPRDTMVEIYGILGDNKDREEAAEAETLAYYEDVYREDV
jgi:hypothetical protein